jgi:fatty acid desaturase
MYNGNGSNNGGRYTRIAGVPVKPIYLYTAGAVALLLVIYLVMRFLSTSLVMHFSAFAGVLVLIANLRELLGNSYGQRGSTALLNVMVGGGLIFAWLTQFFGVLFWIPALILVGVAAPLIFGRANVYNAYLDMARSLATNVRRTFVR